VPAQVQAALSEVQRLVAEQPVILQDQPGRQEAFGWAMQQRTDLRV
jgi:hypothetical protein